MAVQTISSEGSRLMSEQREDEGSTELAPPISMRLVTEQCMGNIPFALKLLAEFEVTAQERMTAIERESSALNLDKVGQIAHSLAGVASILTADPLSDIACRLQDAAEGQDLPLATDLILQLRLETDRVLGYLPGFRTTVEQSDAAAP